MASLLVLDKYGLKCSKVVLSICEFDPGLQIGDQFKNKDKQFVVRDVSYNAGPHLVRVHFEILMC